MIFLMDVIVLLALLILSVGFLGGILVGVVLTAWVMKPKNEKVKNEDPESDDVDLTEPMEVDDASFGGDPPTDVETEEIEVKRPEFLVPEETPVRTMPVETMPIEKKMGLPADYQRAREKTLFINSETAFKTPECLQEGRTLEIRYNQRKCCDECIRPKGDDVSQIWICHYPSQVYHTSRGCGKLKAARRIQNLQVCKCRVCSTYWKDHQK